MISESSSGLICSVKLMVDKVGHDRRLKALLAFRVSPNSCHKMVLGVKLYERPQDSHQKQICIVKLLIDKVGHDMCLKA